MTLVIAKQFENEILLIGDTRFDFEEKANREKPVSESDRYFGGLKVVILAPGLCVAFAGEVRYARDAIEGIYEQNVNLFDKTETINYFLSSHKESQQGSEFKTDYIVATICSNQSQGFTKEIFKIAQGKVTWSSPTLWIGDSAAFRSFQKSYLSETTESSGELGRANFEIAAFGNDVNSAFVKEATVNLRAFSDVINDISVESVDGIRTVVFTTDNSFGYCEYLVVNGVPIAVRPNDPKSPVTFGGAEEGSHALHVGVETRLGLGVFPIYFYNGKLGIAYQPTKQFLPRWFPNCTLEEFRCNARILANDDHARFMELDRRLGLP